MSQKLVKRNSTDPRKGESLISLNRAMLVMLVCYWFAMFIGTHLPHPYLVANASDKVLHLLAFTGLGFLVCVTTARDFRLPMKRAAAIVLLLAAYAALDEFSQIPVGRNCELLDWCADAVGAVIGVSLFAALGAAVKRATSKRRASLRAGA